jgi:hypothetical protein
LEPTKGGQPGSQTKISHQQSRLILCTNNTVTKKITFSSFSIGEMIDKSLLSKIKQFPQKVYSKLNSNSKYPQNKSSTMIGICN